VVASDLGPGSNYLHLGESAATAEGTCRIAPSPRASLFQETETAMPKFKVAVPHQHQREHVVERLKSFSDKMRGDAPVELTDVSETWDENGNMKFSFKAMSMKVSGEVVIESEQIVVNGKLPLAASMFRGMIEKQIEEKIREALTQ